MFPYLRLPRNRFRGEETADLWLWLEFWLRHLGGVPATVGLFLEGVIGALNVPEERPEEIDPTFEPTILWEPTDWLRYRVEPPDPVVDPQVMARIRRQIGEAFGDERGLLIDGRGPPYPPGTIVNWEQAVAHYEATASARSAGKNPWKRLSDETLRAMYPKHGDEHAAVRKPDDPV